MNARLIACAAVLATVLFSAAGPAEAGTNLTALSDATEDLVARVQPGVVQVLATGYGPGGPARLSSAATSSLLTTQRSTGSGVIIDASGYIITNAHVIGGAQKVHVVLPHEHKGKGGKNSIVRPRGQQVEAKLVGLDRETDLALLKVSEKNLPTVKIGDSDKLRTGELVVAIGSPMGLGGSVSLGVVSALGRQRGPEDRMVYIQTDAPINPGHSGGALVDTEGNLVGINTFILSHSGGSEGIGFAAPSNIVKSVYQQLKTNGRVRRGNIGAFPQTITPLLADALGLGRDRGVVLGDVEPGGPAYAAGLQIGDIILSMGGKPMENGRQLEVNVYQHPPGDVIEMEIERAGVKSTEYVSVREREGEPERIAEMVRPEKNLVPGLGILGIELDSEVTKHLPPLRISRGVAVAGRAADGPLFEMPLVPGDVIIAVNGTDIVTLEQLREEIDQLPGGEAAVLQVQRGPGLVFVAFEAKPKPGGS
ncbi:MAG: trypsin-like peptidase domain-containing protein [Candidatus Binatia bacterium]|nr:trypsin-like peptidase domain-containing protein [Candidatus Binatia bacterium]